MQLQMPSSSTSLTHTMYVGLRWMEGEVDKHFCVDISGAVLVVYRHCSSPVQGSGIQCLVWYCKGCIPGLWLFQSKQSTHDVFCRFPQWSCGDSGAPCCQTGHHPSFLHLSLVLGCLPIGAGNCWGVLLKVVHCCGTLCGQYLLKLLRADAQAYW